MPNGLEKYISFSLDNKLPFIASFPVLYSLSNSLVRNLVENDRNHLSQEFIASFQYLYFFLNNLVKNLVENDRNHFSQESDSEVLYLFKQKEYYPYEYM